jgi:hypothetical protein
MSIIKDQASSALDQYIKEVRNRYVALAHCLIRAVATTLPWSAALDLLLSSAALSAPTLGSLANEHVCVRNYAEDQRKRAARQVRDLVNIAKQGGWLDLRCQPVLPSHLGALTRGQRWAPSSSNGSSIPSTKGPWP